MHVKGKQIYVLLNHGKILFKKLAIESLCHSCSVYQKTMISDNLSFEKEDSKSEIWNFALYAQSSKIKILVECILAILFVVSYKVSFGMFKYYSTQLILFIF